MVKKKIRKIILFLSLIVLINSKYHFHRLICARITDAAHSEFNLF